MEMNELLLLVLCVLEFVSFLLFNFPRNSLGHKMMWSSVM